MQCGVSILTMTLSNRRHVVPVNPSQGCSQQPEVE